MTTTSSIKKKLAGSEGISLPAALLCVAVAAMVSVLVLSAAMTTFKNVRSDKMEQQAYLTLNSASEVFKKYATDTNVTVTIDRGDPTKSTVKASEGTLKQLMAEAVQKTFDNALTSYSNTVTVKAPSGSDNTGDVTVALVMKPYNDGTFLLPNAEDESFKAYFTFEVSDPQGTKYVQYLNLKTNATTDGADTYKLAWTSPIVSKAEVSTGAVEEEVE